MARQIGCGDIISKSLYAQATIKCEEANYEAAEGMYRESILVARSFNDCLGPARSLKDLSEVLERRGNSPESAAALKESCSFYREISFRGRERVYAAQKLARSKEAAGDMVATFFGSRMPWISPTNWGEGSSGPIYGVWRVWGRQY